MRLNQAIAKSGVCSRRKADLLIAQGKVLVNGRVIRDFSFVVDPVCDKLTISGRPYTIKTPTYIAMYKPVGIITTTNDEQGRKNILELIPPALRHLKPVGRLDKNSEGLILLTNDGQLTQQITHPNWHISKCYLVTVAGFLSDKNMERLSKGIKLEEGMTLPTTVSLKARDQHSTCFEIVLQEGRNRQIRRMCECLGHSVKRLVRLSIGGLKLGRMTPGTWRYLTTRELRSIMNVEARSSEQERQRRGGLRQPQSVKQMRSAKHEAGGAGSRASGEKAEARRGSDSDLGANAKDAKCNKRGA